MTLLAIKPMATLLGRAAPNAPNMIAVCRGALPEKNGAFPRCVSTGRHVQRGGEPLPNRDDGSELIHHGKTRSEAVGIGLIKVSALEEL